MDGKLIIAGPTTAASHTETKEDTENGWPTPTAAKFTLTGTTGDGKTVSAEINGKLGGLADKVDVMAEVPGFVKQIVAGAVGTKPYIYQVIFLLFMLLLIYCSSTAHSMHRNYL